MANAWATRAACRWPIPAMTNSSEILVHEKRKKPSIIFAVSETDRYASYRKEEAPEAISCMEQMEENQEEH